MVAWIVLLTFPLTLIADFFTSHAALTDSTGSSVMNFFLSSFH